MAVRTDPIFARPALAGWGIRLGWRMPLFVASLVLGVIGRVAYSWHAPLWFDETYSAVIATQPTVSGLVDWCLNELTGPAFYMPLWMWTKIAGSSDTALRMPSLVLSIAAPVLIAWRGDRDRDLRLFWAVFALLWVPIFGLAGEARAYPQLFVLGVLQAMAFVRLLRAPDTSRAALWVGLSALLILTHYAGAVPGMVQGAVYLGYHRRRAAATWPAALLLAPMLAWAYVHLPTVVSFTGGNDDAHAGLPLSDVARIPAMVLGVGLSGTIVFGAILVSSAIVFLRGRGGRVAWTPESALAVSGVAGVALILAAAFWRPGFAPRYMTPAMPAFLFALAVWARWMLPRDSRAVAVVMAMTLATAVGLVVSILGLPDRDPRHLFNLQRPSAWLADRRPDTLVMFWDGPIAAMTSSAHLDEVGGFFLRRDGRPMIVRVARATAEEDPNRAVLALAGGNAAILWTANDNPPQSRNPQIERYDPRFECRDFGGGQLTMTACRLRR